MSLAPRAVLVHRTTEYEELLARHGTHGQAAYFLGSRGRDIAEVAERHHRTLRALAEVAAAVPASWRQARVERADLDRFLFGPEDVVVVVGQDGLVANAAKYLDGQPVVGIDTDPGRNPGVLVRHRAADARKLLPAAASGRSAREALTMVAAVADDTQRLLALNEIYLGPPGHQTARYRLGRVRKVPPAPRRLARTLAAPGEGPSTSSTRACARHAESTHQTPQGPPSGRTTGLYGHDLAPDAEGEPAEPQASSGVLVGTGTGATGWLRSLWLQRGGGLALPTPTERQLAWFVREAWPSPATGTARVEGLLGSGEALRLTVESERLVAFGDGMEGDALDLTWGQTVRIGVADTALHLAG
ncbi:hypothetical protein RCO28_21320 [Streptomyces sp. LHD-70]|uniref:hypothetical protein n=1 Tax=Streptomyces sp. LHD-70 TaxID=3072140 RepID=UPI00280C4B67|nr:hypothetical protein [Streptomyces sp. LHD-70]MDQ8705013.1 hypothetical protein [Streptomyces sp. LHD-70]